MEGAEDDAGMNGAQGPDDTLGSDAVPVGSDAVMDVDGEVPRVGSDSGADMSESGGEAGDECGIFGGGSDASSRSGPPSSGRGRGPESVELDFGGAGKIFGGGSDDSSCSGSLEGGDVVGSASRRRTKRRRVQEQTAAEEALQYQPVTVNEHLCQALLWNGGQGQLQCCWRPEAGTQLCAKHRRATHGLV